MRKQFYRTALVNCYYYYVLLRHNGSKTYIHTYSHTLKYIH